MLLQAVNRAHSRQPTEFSNSMRDGRRAAAPRGGQIELRGAARARKAAETKRRLGLTAGVDRR